MLRQKFHRALSRVSNNDFIFNLFLKIFNLRFKVLNILLSRQMRLSLKDLYCILNISFLSLFHPPQDSQISGRIELPVINEP